MMEWRAHQGRCKLATLQVGALCCVVDAPQTPNIIAGTSSPSRHGPGDDANPGSKRVIALHRLSGLVSWSRNVISLLAVQENAD
jgi:hypothetical protein